MTHLRHKIGNARRKLKRLALASYDHARAIDPGYAQVLSNCGNAFAAASQFKEALTFYDRSLKVRPDDVETLNDHSVVLRRLNRTDAALVSIDRALALRPDHAQALIGRGKIMRLRGDIDQAIKCFREAMKLRPDDSVLHSGLIFSLNFDPSASEADRQFERAEWDRKHAQKFSSRWVAHDNDPVPGRKLRIGYVSRYFRHDNAAYSFANAILNRDSDRFEIFCYSDTVAEDDVTDRLRERANQWYRTKQLSDDQLAELIRRDRIDILVDCVGHMVGNRLLVFARKPAPIQVTAFGEPTGTGLKAMDYLMASPVLVPESDRGLFSERIVDLPNFAGFWTPDPLPDVGPLPARTRGHVTFGSFNRVAKIGYPTIRCWAALLRRLPQARLVLKNPQLADAGQRMRIAAAFEAEGVPTTVLTILRGTDRESHFAAYNAIDIALDPFPHAGGYTTLDALWMGVPVVTWAGKTVSSRWAATSLAPLGLTDFIADSPESYVELAVAKASDLESLSRLRASLRTRMATSEFGDGARYCRAVEAAYVEMWERWCREQSSRVGPQGENGTLSAARGFVDALPTSR
jgi:predicted O-linked N-acetylglucosamine transferase (SPINDLY family)